MLVGLVSDTHDRLDAAEAAVRVFNDGDVGYVLHAGDHVAPFVVGRYWQLQAPWRGVYGNNDGERAGLLAASGGRISGDLVVVEVGGVRILLAHKEEVGLDAAKSGAFGPVDVLVCGHTHRKGSRQETVGDRDVLVVNPGEACGYLTGRATVALLDTESRQVEWVDLDLNPGAGR